MMPLFSTSDLYDAFGDSCQSCETQFRQYSRCTVFSGKIRTVRCIGDNVLLRRMLETESEGEVLVVDGSGYLGSALMGVGSLSSDLRTDGRVPSYSVQSETRTPCQPWDSESKPSAQIPERAKSMARAMSTSSCHLAAQLLPPVSGFTVMTTEYRYAPDD